MRRATFVLLALMAVGQTGCCGRVRAFFYRLFTCDTCGPYYGFGAGAPVAPAYGVPAYAAPSFGAPGCSTCATPAYSPVPAMPATYPTSYNGGPVAPVFGPSTPLPAPSVHPSSGTGIPTPMAEKK